MAHEGENTLLDQQNSKLDGGALGNTSIKKPNNPIGNSSATHQRRTSVGSSYNGDSSRRDSSGKFSSSNNKVDVTPRYLRASTGSCHDYCKYGKKHIVEEKPWHSISKRAAKTPSSKLRSKEHTISVEESKKVTGAKHRPQETKTHADDLNHLPDSKTISQNSSEIIKNKVSLPPKEGKLSPEKLETAKDVLETKLKTSNIPVPQPKVASMKASPSSETSEGIHRKGRINRKIKDEKLPLVSNPFHSSDASQGELRRSRIHSDMKDRKTIVESEASQKKVPRALDNLPSPTVSSTNNIKKLTSRKNSNSKLVLKDQNILQKAVNVKQHKNEKVSVKTLYALETDTVKTLSKTIRKKLVTASSHKQDPAEEDTIVCNHHDFEDGKGERDEEETGGMDDAPTKLITINKDASSKGKRKEGVEGKITRTLKKGTLILSKDKNSSPMKLNFRRGKVIQLHTDNNTPIRLKFRRGKMLLGNKDGMANVKKNCKKKGVVDDKDVADPSSKKVVLRHQDVQDKKNDPGLLNNVIEETASKLVESRKSKVKALVGAFETVISLQES